jgi:hypothetical protein
LLTLINDEAVLCQVLAGDAASIGPKEEQDFGRILPDGLHAWLVPKIQRSYLTGHPVVRNRQKNMEFAVKTNKNKFYINLNVRSSTVVVITCEAH